MKWKISKKKKSISTGAKQRSDVASDYVGEALARVKLNMGPLQLPYIRRPAIGSSDELLNPRLPINLTSLNDVQLGRLHGEFCLMAQYVQLQMAVKAVEKATAQKAEKITRAESLLRRSGTVADKAAQVEIDPRVLARSLSSLVGENVEKLSEAFFEVFLIGRDACSREMSRRQWISKESNP